MQRPPILAALAALALSTPALADPAGGHGKSLETCLKAAIKVFGGEALNVEYKAEEGAAVYDFDVKAADGLRWEVECNARSGVIREIEREVGKDDPLFKAAAKVSEDDARRAALAVFPGKVETAEYGIEHDGSAVYEFDVLLSGGGQIDVEVDAATGKITEANPELWEIGEEE